MEKSHSRPANPYTPCLSNYSLVPVLALFHILDQACFIPGYPCFFPLLSLRHTWLPWLSLAVPVFFHDCTNFDPAYPCLKREP